ncbi:RHS repeat-associated core domain-containing protein [Pseudoalteromonas rubra]|uniref:RHS repeat-associated core domain-containing protein n=1 Tax=Pseudoalteromonas rubra TaxID=43658 RepID=UPI0014867345|nr:FG-GAP-like repeat-containing protein [Pseudoalteromonas rubra]
MSDKQGGVTDSSFKLTVNRVGPTGITLNEDTQYELKVKDLPSVDISLDGEISTSKPTHGIVRLASEQAPHSAVVTYVPGSNYCGSDSFTLETNPTNSCDGCGPPDYDPWSHKVEVTVNCVNDAPKFGSSGLEDLNIDQGTTRSMSFTVSDIDNSASQLSVSVVSSSNPQLLPTSSVLLSGSGSNRVIQLVPNPKANGSSKVKLKITDPEGLSSEKEFTLTVNAVVGVEYKKAFVPVRRGSITIFKSVDRSPSAPEKFSNVERDGKYHISWNESTDASYYVIDQFINGVWVTVGSKITGNSFSISSGNGARFRFTACNDYGCSKSVDIYHYVSGDDVTLSATEDQAKIILSSQLGIRYHRDWTTVISEYNGTVSHDTINQRVVFTPKPNFCGAAAFRAQATIEGNSGSAQHIPEIESVRVVINVACQNDAPTLKVGSGVTMAPSSQVVYSVYAYDIDNKDSDLQLEVIDLPNVLKVLDIKRNGSRFDLTIQSDFLALGNEALTIAVSDGHARSETHTIPVTFDATAIETDSSMPMHFLPESIYKGELKGESGIDGGAFTYRLPLYVPPGRNGVQPKLALNYNSQSGKSSAGYGWSFSGIEAIARCSTNFSTDGYQKNVTYNNDKLCLNGSRLILASGKYGLSGATYHPERNPGVHVSQYGNMNSSSAKFTVTDAKGERKYFGLSANSQFKHAGAPYPHQWLLEKVQDPFNNTIHYGYTLKGSESLGYQKLLASINYTGSGDAKGDRKVELNWHNPTHTRYLWGGKFATGARLDYVKASAKDIQRVYKLAYSDNKLSSVRLCANTQCTTELAKKSFSWYSSGYLDYIKTANHPLAELTDTRNMKMVGIPYSSGADYNGDGIEDLKAKGDIYLIGDEHRLNRMNMSHFPGYKTAVATIPDGEGYTGYRYYSNAMSGRIDYNRNGIPDVMYLDEQKQWRIGEYNHVNDTYSLLLKTNIDGQCLAAVPGHSFVASCKSFLTDLNGDGFQDIVSKTDAGYSFHLRNTSRGLPTGGFKTVGQASGLSKIVSTDIEFADINGDGIQDIYIPNSAVWFDLTFSENRVTVKSLDMDVLEGIDLVHREKRAIWLDKNGDGLLDVMILNKDEKNRDYYWTLRINQGGGAFSAAIKTGLREFGFPALSFQDQRNTYNANVQTFDFNHDGLVDLLVPAQVLQRYSCWDLNSRQPCEVAAEDSGEPLPLLYNLDVWRWKVLISQPNNAGFIEHKLPSSIRGSLNGTGLADVNGDGYQDIVATEGFDPKSFESSCDINTKGSYGQIYCYSGDNEGVHVYLSQANNVHLMRGVHNQYATELEVQYSRLGLNANTDAGIYTSETHDLENARHVRAGGGLTVVKQLDKDAGNGKVQTKQYHYANGLFHTQGRGFQGFERITEVNITTGIKSDTQFFTEFPFAGMVKSKVLTRHSDEALISRYDTTQTASKWCDSAPADVYSPHVVSSRERTYDLATQQEITDKSVKNNYACFGALKSKTVTVSDETSTKTNFVENTYKPSSIDHSYVMTSSKKGNARAYKGQYAHTKSSNSAVLYTEFSNFQGNKARNIKVCGSVADDKVSSLSGLSCSLGSDATKVTELEFDSYGNTVKTTHSQSGQDSTVASLEGVRWQSTTYDWQGYFPEASYNSQWGKSVASQTYKYDTFWGKQTAATNVQGITTTNHLDLLGRVTLTVQHKGKQLLSQPTNFAYTSCSNDRDCPAAATTQIWQVQDGSVVSVVYRDSLGREVGTKVMHSADNIAFTEQRYDAAGNLIYKSHPHNKQDGVIGSETYLDFDVLGRPASKQTDAAPLQYSAAYQYDGLTTHIDVTPATVVAGGVSNFSVSRTYSGKELVHTADANGGSTRFTYHANGQPNYIEDASGSILRASYNGMGHKVAISDPNMGSWSYQFNVLNELRRQTDGRAYVTTFNYDKLGRTIRRVAGSNTASWLYDSQRVGLGLLDNDSTNEYTRSYDYNELARVESELLTVGNQSISQSYTYNAYGMVESTSYGNGYTSIEHVYTNYGQPYTDLEISGNATKALVTYDEFNAQGKLVQQTFGNGLIQRFNYYPGSSLMESVCTSSTGVCSGENVQYQSYAHDAFGNLVGRNDIAGGRDEQYSYDLLHRLEQTTISVGNISVDKTYSYDAVGNLLSKSDYASEYKYGNSDRSLGGNAGPNAIRSVLLNNGDNATFKYDSNGNLLSSTDGDLNITYTHAMKPERISRNGKQLNFVYDAANSRIKQTRSNDGTTVYYMNGYELEVGTSSSVHKVYVGNHSIISNDAEGARITHTHVDRLGSITSLSSGDLHINHKTEKQLTLQRRSYDSFGRVFEAYNEDALGSFLATRRGFTGHEHLPDVGLIHMNGRGYDPLLGRFLSVDPFIQSPTNTQSVNPYSYILNNPLSGTDPTGYKFETDCDSGTACAAAEKADSGASAMSNCSSSAQKTQCMLNSNRLSNGQQNEQSGSVQGGYEFYKSHESISTRARNYVFDNFINPLPDLEAAGDALAEGDLPEFAEAMVGIVGKKVKAAGKVVDDVTDLVSDLKEKPISVDEALNRASNFLKPDHPVRSIEGKTGVQFIQEFSEDGKKITLRVGFDLNPNSSHVKQLGPHLNLQTQINGKIQKKGPLKDPHTPIDPKTIRKGDY